jgi:hypothetical protein
VHCECCNLFTCYECALAVRTALDRARNPRRLIGSGKLN